MKVVITWKRFQRRLKILARFLKLTIESGPESLITWFRITCSERNPLKMKVAITWRRFQLGLKILARFQKVTM